MSGLEKHRDHGEIIHDIIRPSQELIDALARHDTAKIGDTMGGNGIMHYEIKPLSPEMRIAGPALTVLTKPGDALYVQKAIDLAQPGDVVVINSHGYKDVAVIGERLAYFYKLKGVAGIVCDGGVRDSQGMIDGGPPTFARSVCIKIFGTLGPGAINVPVQCGGIGVNPGDIIIGDRDGVVVVPREDGVRILELANKHLEGELERLKHIESGMSVTEAFGLDAKTSKWVD